MTPGTNAWAGYNNVNNLNSGVYQHEVVVHTQEFVHSVHCEIHTQNIEGLWMHAKRKLRYQRGISRSLFASYLAAFQWRFSHKSHVFGQFLQLLSDNYTLHSLRYV